MKLILLKIQQAYVNHKSKYCINSQHSERHSPKARNFTATIANNFTLTKQTGVSNRGPPPPNMLCQCLAGVRDPGDWPLVLLGLRSMLLLRWSESSPNSKWLLFIGFTHRRPGVPTACIAECGRKLKSQFQVPTFEPKTNSSGHNLRRMHFTSEAKL